MSLTILPAVGIGFPTFKKLGGYLLQDTQHTSLDSSHPVFLEGCHTHHRVYTEYFVPTRHCAKCFIHIISFDLCLKCERTFLFAFYRRGHRCVDTQHLTLSSQVERVGWPGQLFVFKRTFHCAEVTSPHFHRPGPSSAHLVIKEIVPQWVALVCLMCRWTVGLTT